MIIIRISGGIGNQLFQYALGRALALRSGKELKLDTTFYEMGIEPDRSFKLTHFNIPAISEMIARPDDFKKIGIPHPTQKSVLAKIQRSINRKIVGKIIRESGFDFHPEILKTSGDCYLSGVWQSEKYFIDYTDEIRNDFSLSAPLSEAATSMAARIQSAGEGSISLHIRRGDQVHNTWLLEKHGSLGQDYYLPAVEYISGKISAPQLFVFSDDIGWCKEHMRFDLPTTFVSEGDIPDYEELTLMSLCKHNIIAKSSFSWWGAWLNRNPQQIVVAPARRFGDPKVQAGDLIPESWVKL